MIDLKKHFDKVYVINLDRRPDRYELFKEELKKHNIQEVERYPAIDGNLMENKTNLLPGELGILLTHLQIIRDCIKNDVKNVLILEDDVCFTDEIKNLEDYMTLVPKDWEFIYFGGNHVYGESPERLNDKIIKLNFTVALQCVAINGSIFEALEAILSNMDKQVDALYAYLHDRFNAYGFYPNMATQTAGFSDIQERFVDYSNFFKN